MTKSELEASPAISSEEYDLLNEFCLKHQVKYYDVRLELIRHLADQIEKLRNETPGLTFEQGLGKVYDSYGATGFRRYVAKKEEDMELSVKELAREIFTNAFEKPAAYGVWAGIIYFMAFGFLLFQSGSVVSQYFFLSGAFIVIVIELFLVVKIIQMNRTKKMPILMTSKANAVYAFSGLSWITLIQIGLNPIVSLPPYVVSNRLLFYTLIGLMFLLFLIGSLGGFQYAEDIFRKARWQYPEAFKN